MDRDSNSHVHKHSKKRVRMDITSDTGNSSSGEDTDTSTIYRKLKNGNFVSFKRHRASRISTAPTPMTQSSSESKPPILTFTTPKPTTPAPTTEAVSKYATSEHLIETWDGWPDSEFTLVMDAETWKRTKRLVTHWAMQNNGGDRTDSLDAPKWEGGKRSTRVCLGHMSCSSDTCRIIVRPLTDKDAQERQMSQKCRCGAELRYEPCQEGVTATIHQYSGGTRIHYYHSGPHNHPRPTHELHLTAKAEQVFRDIIKHHPSAKPSMLVAGLATLDGPHTESTAKIAPPLVNKAWVAYEKRKTKKSGPHFLRDFAQFTKDCPDFLVQEISHNGVKVTSFQTEFMQSQLAREIIEGKAVNGLVSDGAHGFWKERNNILIVSSAYSPVLHCWVPVLFTYSNGASAEHFEWHFFALFKSIGARAKDREVL